MTCKKSLYYTQSIYLSTLLLLVLSIVVVSVVAVAVVVALIAILIINKKSNLNVSGKFRHVMMFSTISSPSMYIYDDI